MTSPAVFWPTLLGVCFLLAGIITYRRDLRAATLREGFGLLVLGPVFIAAALAAFAGEHFTAAKSLARIVPKFMPAHLFVAYFVGVAHLAAALSFVARRCMRWSSLLLAIMFALFVLLMDLPGAIRHPGTRLFWSLTAREATFSMGALALFSTQIRQGRPNAASRLATAARVWVGGVVVFYGVEHILYPRFSPGVPDSRVTSAWVPLPHLLAYAVGVLLIAFGIAMFIGKRASSGAALAGLLMVLLTLFLYVPEFFFAHNVPQWVEALNFVFDTLLFAGTLLVIGKATLDSESAPIAKSHAI